MARLRSRKVCIWLCVQGLAQLDKTYGEVGRRIIIDNCSCLLVLGSKDTTATKILSELAGQYRETKVSRYRNGITQRDSMSQNVSQEYRFIFDTSDFARMKNDGKLFVYIDGEYYYLDKCMYHTVPLLAEKSAAVREENDELLDIYEVEGDEL